MRAIGIGRAPRDSCPGRTRGRSAAPRRVAVELTPRAVEQVAVRVAQLLDGRRAPELLTGPLWSRRSEVRIL
ncbi:MAG: hypothetical protein ACRDK7_12605 [Solirubrobacteraceae bacterium]